MSARWPPPPDLESIQELVRNADIEGLILIHGAPADEYEPEGDRIHAAIQHLPIAEITVPKLQPILKAIWREGFINDEEELALRRPALLGLAEQIARFFGPEAQPEVRQQRR